ncbi:MAG TPA: hypothetical protein VM050_12470 [Patescibacteria group bacterium]|nr:hypothetical protein [Patescibacteria group bacterium]
MDGFKRYLFTGILTWVIVDFTTAFNPDFQRWLEHMPLIWAFYIGYPLVFANLIYTRGWNDKRIFYAMIAGAFFVEIVCSGNALLYTFPIMVVMIPVAVAIYTIVTFLPKWITDGDLQGRRRTLAILGLVYLTVAFLNYQSNLGT